MSATKVVVTPTPWEYTHQTALREIDDERTVPKARNSQPLEIRQWGRGTQKTADQHTDVVSDQIMNYQSGRRTNDQISKQHNGIRRDREYIKLSSFLHD